MCKKIWRDKNKQKKYLKIQEPTTKLDKKLQREQRKKETILK